MKYTIVDCYTDEASGLGVPPYLGTYPRYIAGYLDEPASYLTIDDIRLWKKNNSRILSGASKIIRKDFEGLKIRNLV